MQTIKIAFSIFQAELEGVIEKFVSFSDTEMSMGFK